QADPTQVAATVTQLIATREQGQHGGAGGTPEGIALTADERTNQIVVVAPAERMAEIIGLIEGLDKPLDLVTKVYRLKTVAPERVDKLMKNLLGPAAKRIYQA